MSNHPSQVILDHFVMVRIHARQPLDSEGFTPLVSNTRLGRLDTSWTLLKDRSPPHVPTPSPAAPARYILDGNHDWNFTL